MYVPTACSLAAFLKLVSCLGQTFIIFAEIEKRQLSKVAAAGASRTTVYALCFRLYAFGFMLSALSDRTSSPSPLVAATIPIPKPLDKSQ